MMPQLWQTDIHNGIALADLHEKMIAFAESHFDRHGKVPFLWMINDGSHLLWVKTNWEDDVEKYQSAQFMRKLLQVSNARSYSFMHEIWIARFAPGEETMQPSQMPANRRDDALVITTQERGGPYLNTQYLVTLSQPKNFLGPRVDAVYPEGAVMGGELWNLFEPPKNRADIEREAKEKQYGNA
jgi:hypothetical protein